MHGGSGWKQGVAPVTSAVQYDLQQARFSRHLWGQSFSERHYIHRQQRGLGWTLHCCKAVKDGISGWEKSTTGLLLQPVHISMNSSLAFDVHSQCPLTASIIKRRQNVFTATSRREERESSISHSLGSAACPGATFAKGVSLSWHPRPPHRPPTACWLGALLSQAALASSPLLGASVQVCAGCSASPLRWTGR